MAAGASLQIAIYVAIGIFVRKRNLVDASFARSLGAFLVNIALPCLIIQSLRTGVSVEHLLHSGPILLLSVCTLGLSLLVGQLCHIYFKGSGRGRLYRYGLFISNFTFMGMPLSELLLGQTGVFYFSLFTVPARLLYYSTVEYLLSPPRTDRRGLSLKELLRHVFLSPPILGVVIGIVCTLTAVQFPAAIESVLNGLKGVCSPLGMVLCGLTIGDIDLRRWLKPRWLGLPLLRLLVLPGLIFCIMRLLPLDPLLKQTAVLFAMLPCPGLMTTYAVRYDPDPDVWAESSAYILLSTLLSLVTLPLWAQLLPLL